jgi:hypothetical protein
VVARIGSAWILLCGALQHDDRYVFYREHERVRIGGRRACSSWLYWCSNRFDSLPNSLYRRRQLPQHKVSVQAQHTIAQATKVAVPPCIGGAVLGMPAAVNFEVRSTLPRKPTAAAWSIDGIPCLGKSSSYAVS